MTVTTPLQEKTAPNAIVLRFRDVVEPYGFAVVIVASLAIAVYLRIWLLGFSGLNSDEATVGLNARQILHGHFSTFFWGQDYGGVEPYLVAVMFLLFGSSTLVLNATPAVLALLACVVVWRIGRRLFAPAAAVVAATLSFIWPESSVWNSTKEYGFHQVGVLLGLLVVLISVRIIQTAKSNGNDPVRDWMLLGLTAGLGWWATPETLYFTIPSAVFVVLSLRAHGSVEIVKRVIVCLSAVIVGALPWIIASIRDGFATLSTGLPSPVPYSTRLSTFFTHVFPMIMGLRIEGVGQWEVSPGTGQILVVLIGAALVAAMIVLTFRVPDARCLVACLVIYPFLYAAFPTSSFWNDGRYGIALAPIASLVGVGALWQIARPRVARWLSAGILAAALASTVVAVDAGYGGFSKVTTLSGWRANAVPTVTLLGSRLQSLGIRDVYAGYWIAYDLAFLSGGQIAVNPVVLDRNQAESDAVDKASDVAWVFVPPADISQVGGVQTPDLNPGELAEATLASRLTANGIPFRTDQIGPFELVIPRRNVVPEKLLGPPPGVRGTGAARSPERPKTGRTRSPVQER